MLFICCDVYGLGWTALHCNLKQGVPVSWSILVLVEAMKSMYVDLQLIAIILKSSSLSFVVAYFHHFPNSDIFRWFTQTRPSPGKRLYMFRWSLNTLIGFMS